MQITLRLPSDSLAECWDLVITGTVNGDSVNIVYEVRMNGMSNLSWEMETRSVASLIEKAERTLILREMGNKPPLGTLIPL